LDSFRFLVTATITRQVFSSEPVVPNLHLGANGLNAHCLAPRFDIRIKRGRNDNDTVAPLLVPLDPIERFRPN
jgi:hypothetical protein